MDEDLREAEAAIEDQLMEAAEPVGLGTLTSSRIEFMPAGGLDIVLRITESDGRKGTRTFLSDGVLA